MKFMKPKGFANLFIIIAALVALSAIASTYLVLENQKTKAVPEPRFCTQEAKQCPDGSYVGRTGPACEFAPCPTATTPSQDEIAGWKTYRNEQYGFEVKYPALWIEDIANPRAGGSILVKLIDSSQNVFPPTDQARDFFFVGVYLDVAEGELVATVAGKQALINQWGKRYAEIPWRSIYFTEGKKIYIRMSSLTPRSQVLEDEMLSTFKFISVKEVGELKIIEKIQQQATFEGSGTLESVQFIAKDKVLLRVTTGQGLRVAGILDFSADPPKALVSFEDKAQFSQEEWQHLMQQYGDQAYSATTYTTNVIRNGVAQSFPTLTKVPENVFLIDYDKATKAPVPLSLFPPNMPASLLALADAQRKRVQAVAHDAALFELTLFPRFNGTTLVRSSFVKPSDDVNYFSIEDDFKPPPTPNHTDEKPSQQAFVLVTCGGAPRNDCGQPTGQPESHDQHLAITGWKVDLSQVTSLLKQDSDFKNVSVKRLVVSTAGRLKNDKYFAKDSKRLANLPAGQPVIQIVGPGQSSEGSQSSDRHSGPYMIVDAIGGGVIEKGTYEYDVVFYP